MDAINQPLLDVRDLSVAFGATLAVDQVSFSIKRGECVALVGEFRLGKIRQCAVDPEAAAVSERLASLRPHPLPRPRSPDGG